MRIILIAFLLFVIDTLNAQESRFKEGETLNVWTASGLNMRDKPDAKAAKMSTIPYGARVVVQPNIGLKIPFEVEEFKGFMVKGYWLLVKYGTTEGFVFDGFLSRLPAPIPTEQDLEIEAYLNNQIGKSGEKYDVHIYDEILDSMRLAKPNEKYDFYKIEEYSFKQNHKKDITYDYFKSYGGNFTIIRLSNSSLYEGYFLIKTYLFNAKTMFFTFDKITKQIELLNKEEGAGCHFIIKKVDNKVVIDGSCGC